MNLVDVNVQAAAAELALPGCWLRPLEGEASAACFGDGQ